MKYIYLIYYIRVESGDTVGQGNMTIVLDHEITKSDIEDLYKIIDNESQSYNNYRIRQSKSLIVNIMKLTEPLEYRKQEIVRTVDNEVVGFVGVDYATRINKENGKAYEE